MVPSHSRMVSSLHTWTSHCLLMIIAACTVRTSSCDIISKTPKCTSCTSYRNNLRAMISSSSKIKSPEKSKRLHSSSHTNYRYLHSPQLRERLHNSRNENRALCRKIEQLKSKLEKMTQSAGIDLDSNLNSDLQAI